MKLTNNEPKTIEYFTDEQIKEEGVKDLDNLKPIDHGALAKPHTPIYKIHRYFARRPYSVFYELIKHYSNPGGIVLDPFCGGGVTVVEGLKLRRKLIGVDLNPLATFVTKMECTDINLDKLEGTFKKITNAVKNGISKFYLSKCPKCKKLTPFHWMKWSYVFECPNCKKKVAIEKLKKYGSGRYECLHCEEKFKPIKAKIVSDALIIRVKAVAEEMFKPKELKVKT